MGPPSVSPWEASRRARNLASVLGPSLIWLCNSSMVLSSSLSVSLTLARKPARSASVYLYSVELVALRRKATSFSTDMGVDAAKARQADSSRARQPDRIYDHFRTSATGLPSWRRAGR